jgi:thiol:disulfide interchange protein DsbA
MLKIGCSVLLFLITLTSNSADLVVGKDYELVNAGKVPSSIKNGIEVTEFFSYGCPWCYRLEPAINAWATKKGDAIYFTKVPVVFNNDWEFYAKAFYTADALSLSDKLNPILFKTILIDKKALNSNQAMIDFFAAHGVKADIAKSAFLTSPSINLQISSGKALMARDHINAVPAFVVNNQFKTDLQMAKTEEHLIEILDFLLVEAKRQNHANS